MTSNIQIAFRDVVEGLGKLRLAWWLAWRESFLPYRLGFLGPIWITLQTGLWVGSIAFFIGPSLSGSSVNYIPYVALGFAVYNLFLVFFAEGASIFIRSASFILNIPNPFTVYASKVVFRALLQFAMTWPIIAIAMMATDQTISPIAFVAFPGLLLCLVFGLGVALLLGSLSVVFRDLTFGIQAVMRLLMFVTPIFWVAEAGGKRALVSQFNPIYHFMELIRQPLLGFMPNAIHWYAAIGLSVGTLLIGFTVFAYYRSKLAVWL